MDFNKPRVGIYYFVIPQTGMRNDGAPLYANYNLRKILNGTPNMADDTGNVVHLWPTEEAKRFGTFDLNLFVDHGEDALPVPQGWIPPSPNAYWVSDAHLGYQYRLETAKKFDTVFCCQKRALEEFKRDGVPEEKLFFLPHAFEPDVYKKYEIINKWDWAFIGYLNSIERVDLLDRFCREFPNWYLGWRDGNMPGYNVFDDAAKKFSQSKIIVNHAISDDINMRIFEGMGTGALMLTKNIPTLHDLFVDNQHLVMYSSIDEAVEKARGLLENEEKRKLIADAGYAEVHAKHTYRHRVEQILKTCINYSPNQEEEKCLSV